jgi:hypothetical protein
MKKTPKAPDAHQSKPKSALNPRRQGQDFGLEGTNKTHPEPDAGTTDELPGTNSKFIPKSPYTRG